MVWNIWLCTFNGWQSLSLYSWDNFILAVALATESWEFASSLNFAWASSNCGLMLFIFAVLACALMISGRQTTRTITVRRAMDKHHDKFPCTWISSRACWIRPVGEYPPRPKLARLGSPRDDTVSVTSFSSSLSSRELDGFSWRNGFVTESFVTSGVCCPFLISSSSGDFSWAKSV